MIMFIVGMFVGVVVGMFTMCLMVASKDREYHKWEEKI